MVLTINKNYIFLIVIFKLRMILLILGYFKVLVNYSFAFKEQTKDRRVAFLISQLFSNCFLILAFLVLVISRIFSNFFKTPKSLAIKKPENPFLDKKKGRAFFWPKKNGEYFL